MAELFKLMFLDKNITKIACDNLTYQHIPKEWVGYKFIFREVVDQFLKKDSIPSLGAIAQKFSTNEEVLEIIDEIKEAQVVDRDTVIDQLQSYIQQTEFEILSKKVHDLYNEGKKDEAIKLNAEESKRINEISLRKSGGNFVEVFAGFNERRKQRAKEKSSFEDREEKRKVTLGIDALDEITHGGLEPGDTLMWIARSGVGKSFCLRWHGFSAAMAGESVLHIQLEGGVDMCVDRYDQMWTHQSFPDIRNGDYSQADEELLQKVIRDCKQFRKEISVYGFKRFGEASVVDIRNLCIDYYKIYGHYPRVLVVDSLDLLKTGESKKLDYDPEYKKEKLQKCAQRLKDLAVEFNMVVCTATQASNVPMEIWNNIDKVIDRSYTEGDKTLVKPFSFVFTINQTREEKDENQMRVFIDKLRDHKDTNAIITIATDYDHGKFYHVRRTKELYDKIQLRTKQKEEKIEKADSKPKRKRSSIQKSDE